MQNNRTSATWRKTTKNDIMSRPCLAKAYCDTKSHIDPGIIQSFVEKLARQNGPPLNTLSPVKARAVLNDIQMNTHVQAPKVRMEDIIVTLPRVGKVLLRIVRPFSAPDHAMLPVAMYFHGGGWILGNRFTHDRLIRELATQAHVAIVFVEYTPAPDAQFPTQIEQAYEATRFIRNHGRQLNLDSSHMAFVGDSVGGNMATVVAMLAAQRDPHIIKPVAQLLLYPVTDANFDTASYCAFADGPWLTRASMEWFWDAYLPDVAKRSLPTASPLRAPLDVLRRMPPTFVLTNENDVLRDEGEAYARKLARAGVSVLHVRYLGDTHDFMMLNPLAKSQATRGAVAQTADYLRRVLWEGSPARSP
jgi:acetyl esterase